VSCWKAIAHYPAILMSPTTAISTTSGLILDSTAQGHSYEGIIRLLVQKQKRLEQEAARSAHQRTLARSRMDLLLAQVAPPNLMRAIAFGLWNLATEADHSCSRRACADARPPRGLLLEPFCFCTSQDE